tara:strand:- start:411 stop:572 length:162 start_codon:yes stop_codon:yes gene_type:complete
MEQVWIVLGLLTLLYASGFGFLYKHFSSIYGAQMDITQKLIEKVMKAEIGEEE